MTNFEQRLAALIAKHPHLTHEDAETILKEKSARKKQRRQIKAERIAEKKAKIRQRRTS